MSRYRAGQSLRLTEDGRLVTIWSEAHLSGSYWAHLETADRDQPRPMVLIRITNRRDSALPVVTLLEDS